MKYRNKKNGVVIDVPSEIKGDSWEALKPSSPKEKTEEKKVDKK